MDENRFATCAFCGEEVSKDKDNEITNGKGEVAAYCHDECWEEATTSVEKDDATDHR